MQPDALGSLEDILEAIARIETDTAGLVYESFSEDRRARQLVERNFAIIGEAANRLRKYHPRAAEQISSIHQIIGFRNAIIHGYDRLDYATVWNVVQEQMPVLKNEVEKLLSDASDQSE